MNITDEILNPENIKKLYAREFGLTVKSYRENKGMEAQEFAKQLGVSPSYITRIEQGKVLTPQPEVVRKVADILNINYLLLYLTLGYIDEKTYKTVQSERGNFGIVDVPIYKKIDIEGIRDGRKNQIGKIRYLSKIDYYRYLNGYLISGSPTVIGKPKYTYAIVNLDGNIKNGEIGLFKLNGKSVLRRYLKIKNDEILIDPENSSDTYVVSQMDKLETYGPLVDYIIDMDGTKLEDGKDTPVILTHGGYRRREP